MAILKHIACIMDGNRRWASARGLMPWQGHQEGFNAVERVISFALENDIAHVTLYAFSLENFKRPEDEKSYLFTLLVKKALEQILKMPAPIAPMLHLLHIRMRVK